jgi:hypothetical protein
MPLNNKTTHPVPEGQPDRGLARSTSGVWTSGFNALAVRCVPEGQHESRPAIYRRYWCLENDFVPEGRSKLGLAMADTFSSPFVPWALRAKLRSHRPSLVHYREEPWKNS